MKKLKFALLILVLLLPFALFFGFITNRAIGSFMLGFIFSYVTSILIISLSTLIILICDGFFKRPISFEGQRLKNKSNPLPPKRKLNLPISPSV